MAHSGSSSAGSFSVKLLASYALDWIVLVVITVVGGFLGRIEPNKRPFSLDDPNISFPFADKETVPSWLLVVLCALLPAVVIFLVSFILIPGSTVPKNTSLALVWKRKVWELHVGWLGLLMAVGSAFFFISGIKNMCGKPRPDLLSRCAPDLANAARYVVGGLGRDEAAPSATRLYSGDICRQTDRKKLDDGFRSYPSGHAAAAAAGLIYLSLFLASKLAVTLPFAVPCPAAPLDDSMHGAFPSRAAAADHPVSLEPSRGKLRLLNRNAQYNTRLQSLRRQAAAPPVYLLAVTLVPLCLAIFISASRWFDFRHHGFDILFGFIIGTVTAIFSFRYYHLPIMAGAGWAWGPRSDDRAFWAGVGRLGFAGDNLDDDHPPRMEPPDLGESGDADVLGPRGGSAAAGAGALRRGDRPAPLHFHDVELSSMNRGHQQPPYPQGA
ncbi:PAP2 domain containing protein [Metarhizium album ARSEF 1941]|uniref:PAP2 domain containing protein n=1 Tax=Metarhizium album (strain ARSEF 1941) TaxID=1081103 RepID=A0A0B2WY32_METAS|nr:PAP2 domain containing protein [Metarhizium album ARSEF 1941]KHN98509.1 PAP2 domain containing protein [Metarhizium album ARSEF 1941]